MNHYIASARTNYVFVKDFEAACFDINQNGNTIHVHPVHKDAIMISGDTSTGDFNMINHEDDGSVNVFSWKDWATKHLREGQILIVMSVGAEGTTKFLYCGVEAYTWDGFSYDVDPVDHVLSVLKDNGYEEVVAAPAYDYVSAGEDHYG